MARQAGKRGICDIERAKHMFPDAVNSSAAILVVDDDEFILEFVRLLLVRAGYLVLTAQNGEEAWTLIADHQQAVRLLLTDIVMPDSFDGFELAERVRKRQPDLPILFMTGASLNEYTSEVLLPWEPMILRKPFSPDRLLTFVRENLESANRSI
jgi:two-component system, cell cycle sensor histidine kinase and response regulator CckA